MNDQPTPAAGSAVLPDVPMSPFARAIAVFSRPTEAWRGLETRPQWWFPLLVSLLIQMATVGLLNDRASVPDMQSQFDRMIDAEMLTAAQADKILADSTGPAALARTLGAVAVMTALMTFLLPSLLGFGVSFILGAKLRYRSALAVFCWAGLVRVPEQILLAVLAWYQESMQAVHTGWGAFLPVPEAPTRGFRFLAGLLDSFGPFALWYLVVMAIGASALSGAARKPVTAVVIGLYALLVLVFLGLGALLMPFAV